MHKIRREILAGALGIVVSGIFWLLTTAAGVLWNFDLLQLKSGIETLLSLFFVVGCIVHAGCWIFFIAEICDDGIFNEPYTDEVM